MHLVTRIVISQSNQSRIAFLIAQSNLHQFSWNFVRLCILYILLSVNVLKKIEAIFTELFLDYHFLIRKQKKKPVDESWWSSITHIHSYFYEFCELRNDTYIIRIMRYKSLQHYFYCSSWCCGCWDINKTVKWSRSCQHFFCSLYIFLY